MWLPSFDRQFITWNDKEPAEGEARF